MPKFDPFATSLLLTAPTPLPMRASASLTGAAIADRTE